MVDGMNKMLKYWINVAERRATFYQERQLLIQIRPERDGSDQTGGDERSDGADLVIDTESVDGVMHQTADSHQCMNCHRVTCRLVMFTHVRLHYTLTNLHLQRTTVEWLMRTGMRWRVSLRIPILIYNSFHNGSLTPVILPLQW